MPQPGLPTWCAREEFLFERRGPHNSLTHTHTSTHPPTHPPTQDKIIHYVNQDGRVNAFYSTPSAYANAKIAGGAQPFPLKTDDYMSYADSPHQYWTGYFSSRPALKGYVRETSSFFQAAKQVQALAGGASDTSASNPLYRLEHAMGVLQHHDAVSGTSKQQVAYDYARRLAWGREDGDALMATSWGTLTGDASLKWASCDLANASICPALEVAAAGNPTAVLLYNSQGQALSAAPILLPVPLPAGIKSYAVAGADAKPVTAQLLPLSAEDVHLRTAYYVNSSALPAGEFQWLAFQAALPAMGYAVYFMTPTASADEAPNTHASILTTLSTGEGSTDETLSNGIVSLTLSGATGRVTHFANIVSGVSQALTQDLVYYRSSCGQPGGNSGAYCFRPNSTATEPISVAALNVTVLTGPVINEARQVWGDGSWATQTVRLWAGAATADFVFTIGPIPIADSWGKEVVATYATDLVSKGTYFTDSNARDSQRRQRNARSSYNYTIEEPVRCVPAPLCKRCPRLARARTLTLLPPYPPARPSPQR